MKLFWNIFLLILCAQISMFALPELLTFESMLDRIEGENLRVLLNRETIVQSLQEVKVERAALLPNLQLYSQQNRTKNVSIGYISAQNIFNRFDAKIQGSFTVFDLTKWSDFHNARMGYYISESSHQALVQSILLEAAQAYLQHIRNLKNLELIDANIARDERLLNLAVHSFNAGVANAIDVTRAEGTLAKDQQERLQQQSAVHQSELTIKEMLNLDIHQKMQFDHSFFDRMRLIEDLSVAQTLEDAFATRPDFKQAEQEIESRELALQSAKRQHLPSINVSGEYGYASSEVYDTQYRNQWAVTIEGQMPIFEGGRILAERVRARSEIRQKERALLNLRKQIESEYDLTLFNLNTRFQQIPLAQKQVVLAEQELYLAENRFKNGIADNQEVISAQATLADALDGEVDAIYQFYLAKLQLNFAVGDVKSVLDYRWDEDTVSHETPL